MTKGRSTLGKDDYEKIAAALFRESSCTVRYAPFLFLPYLVLLIMTPRILSIDKYQLVHG